MKSFTEFGIKIPDILLPKNKDMSVWSVIACDQYTQDISYWKRAADCAGSNPSTLNLILPEVYLESPDRTERIQNIRKTMKDYLSNGVFDDAKEEFIYVERKTGYGRIRKGLVVAVDLDSYEWKPLSKALIRATEATIESRIPPRKEIRKQAPIESPPIMLLVNDPQHSLVEKIGELVKKNSPVYDSNLMLDAGHITGWTVSSEHELNSVHDALENLKKANTAPDGSTFLFAVGDGNHSLATAKAVWDEYKTETGIKDSPVRYALVEIVNIYDEGLTFEPIHRVLFGIDADALVSYVQGKLGGILSTCASADELEGKVKNSAASFGFVSKTEDEKDKFILLETPVKELAVSRLQPVLDECMASYKKENNIDCTIDYIHGSDEVFRLGAQDRKDKRTVSILLPPVAKDSFFATINSRGPLPRKSFSMGEASEKRFYLECRKLFD
ncbi:MAG: DUF1015 domain-containing protein [Treponema sp.]|nr:DUF1015 domain-containing protein [Treponema sp.]